MNIYIEILTYGGYVFQITLNGSCWSCVLGDSGLSVYCTVLSEEEGYVKSVALS